MAKVSGKDGTVKYGATPTEIKVTSWQLDQSSEVADVTDSGSTTHKEYIPAGFIDWKGSFEGFFDGSVAAPALNTELALELYVDGTINYYGNAIVTSVGITTNVSGGDAVKVSYSFQGTGTLTEETS